MRAFPSQPHAQKGAGILCCGWEGENPRTPRLVCLPHAHKGARILCCGWKGENPRTPRSLCLPHAHKGARILCCGWEGEIREPPGYCACPVPIKGLGSFVVVDGKGRTREPPGYCAICSRCPPPPRGRSARSAPCARAELCLFSTVPATFHQLVLATFQGPLERRQNVVGTGCWNVAGTRSVGRVGLCRASLSAGRDDRDRGPGGNTGCATPASPTGGTGGHALRAT